MLIEVKICFMALSPWFRIADSDGIVRYESRLFNIELFLYFDVFAEFAERLVSAFAVIMIVNGAMTGVFDALEMTGGH